MDRRHFLHSALMVTGAVCVDMPTFASRIQQLGRPNLRIGILSDIHIGKETTDVFQHTLEYFRDKEVDGVLMAGDLADHGLERELQQVADTWYRVFPKDKAPDGRHVEKIFVYGNHDIEGCNWSSDHYGMSEEEWTRQAIGLHPAESWKRCFREKYQPIHMKTIKGYHFVGAHWVGKNVPGLDAFLDEHAQELRGEKPFFYYQHQHPRGTCMGPWVWGQDDGSVTAQLSQWPNCIAFSGHSHMPLGDDRDLWQGEFTSIGTSSLCYICLFGARENSSVDGSNERVPSQMKNINFNDAGKQGMLMQVYDDCIAIERLEFLGDKHVADNWLIPLPFNPQEAMTFERRSLTEPVPEFAAADRVTLTRAVGKDRYDVEQKQVTVHFPSVLKSRQGVRAFDYEVQVEVRFVDVLSVTGTKRVFSNGCFLSEDKDAAEVTCVYGEGELPANREIRFVVRPCNCYGIKGKPIYSEWVPART